MTESDAASDAALGSLLLREPADDLCLAFVNTKYWRGTAAPTEQLQAPPDLLAWYAEAGVWMPAALDHMRAHWPQAADTLLAEAVALREALYRSVSAAAAQAAPGGADLALVNAALGAAPARRALHCDGGRLLWAVAADAAPVGALALAPVLWSAGGLLAGARLGRVRQCANPQCRWLFLDDSKSGNRRWCAMSACGNRAKAHRHYAKRRGDA